MLKTIKFAKFFHCQTFPLYGIHKGILCTMKYIDEKLFHVALNDTP